jgi:cytochrome d ubiquinol oxidase subunit I
MDVVLLSRLQFAAATFFHFLFVPLTLGLSLLVAWMETKWVRTGDQEYRRMTKFWGKLFIINFAIGVVTGITLEFQFGTNWSRYSAFVGDIFGSLLAVEATLTFFLESTFIAVWIFGWRRLSPKVHCAAIWLVAGAANLSAYWILAANSFMQHPVGYVMRNGRAELDDFAAVITQPWAVLEFVHTVSGAYVLAGFFVLGVSAWHLLRKSRVSFFRRSFKMAATFSLVFSLVVAASGDLSGKEVARHQPAKLAAMESHWQTAQPADMSLLVWPHEAGATNLVEALPIPGLLSWLAFGDFDAEVVGLADFPEADRPPVLITFLSFRAMVALGAVFILVAAWAWWRRKDPQASPRLLKALPWLIPLPYLALQLGWAVAEVGRQPWIVYGLMRTQDAASPVAASQVATTLVGFVVVYGLLGVAAFYLIFKYARRGPVGEADQPLFSGGKEGSHA